MESILNRTVSKYNHYAGQAFDCNLLEYLNDQSLKERVLKIRSLPTKAERDKLKVTLPGITPSAICFPTRSNSNVIAHTGLIVFDIDKLPAEKMDEVFNAIIKMPYVAYCGLSVSGTGYWGLIPISNKSKHTQHFEAMQLYFKNAGIDIPYFDISVKDTSRFRYYSCDLNAHFNHSAQLFGYTFEVPVVPKKNRNKNAINSTENNCFDDFNQNGDIEAILLNNGWTYQPRSDKGTRKRYSRPGKDNGISADYCIERRILYVFSSDPATGIVKPDRGYNHVSVFCQLECGNDIKLCGRKLREMGYGKTVKIIK